MQPVRQREAVCVSRGGGREGRKGDFGVAEVGARS